MNRKSADNWLKRLIDSLEAEIELIPEVVANPTLAGTESDLESLQVGDTKYKIPSGGTEVVANPTLAGTEADLTGLQVGATKYKVQTGTEVEANPTLAGTEADLTGLQVGATKYKVPSGGGTQLYVHNIYMNNMSGSVQYTVTIINSSNEVFNYDKFITYLSDNFNTAGRILPVNGVRYVSNVLGIVVGLYYYINALRLIGVKSDGSMYGQSDVETTSFTNFQDKVVTL